MRKILQVVCLCLWGTVLFPMILISLVVYCMEEFEEEEERLYNYDAEPY